MRPICDPSQSLYRLNCIFLVGKGVDVDSADGDEGVLLYVRLPCSMRGLLCIKRGSAYASDRRCVRVAITRDTRRRGMEKILVIVLITEFGDGVLESVNTRSKLRTGSAYTRCI